ncbi:site-specific DNA-methyltransferase [uncultured Treponema sp.]|uniref:DNA-methyltransferase n=1 Tax=uncultured Treponema sp. TaxID=162155 RepID=UPI0025F99BFD|nr:site-specific DNA-methyltransferase [uncultured Treponema sp.]
MIDLIHGDCLELMKNIPDKSVDMVLCDLPYGMVDCEWDTELPMDCLWKLYHRVCKDNAAILLFAIQPFATDLINSNRKEFRYDIIWEKTMKCGFFNANKMPLRSHEEILVFYKRLPTYNPQKRKLSEEYIKTYMVNIGQIRKNSKSKTFGGSVYQGTKCEKWEYVEKGERFPTSIIKFSNWNGALFGNTTKTTKHPTQKPVPLLEYLIKTYTNEGETVLDNTMGSGSTGVACVNTGRNFIGIEKDNYYFCVAKERIEQAEKGKIIYSRTSAGLMAANKTAFL